MALVMGEASRPPRQLFVRMGGFTLERAGERTEEIPRIRRDGHLCFDLGTLDQRVRAGGDAPVALRYMGVVEWGTVVDTAFRLRPRSGPLSLVLY